MELNADQRPMYKKDFKDDDFILIDAADIGIKTIIPVQVLMLEQIMNFVKSHQNDTKNLKYLYNKVFTNIFNIDIQELTNQVDAQNEHAIKEYENFKQDTALIFCLRHVLFKHKIPIFDTKNITIKKEIVDDVIIG